MPLRILILTESFSPTTETFIYHDAVALQKQAIVKVGCLKRQNESIRPFNAVEVIDVEMSWLRKKWHNQLYKFNIALDFYYRPLKLHLSALLKEFRPQIIHLHFGIQALRFIDNLEFTGPIFITFHGYDATKLVKNSAVYRKRLKELFVRKNIFPLFVSEFLLQYLRGYEIVSRWSQVLYLGIDTDYFKPKEVKKENTTFIFTQISSFRTKKGHTYLLRAFSKLVFQRHKLGNLRLILAGGGPLLKACKNMVEQYKLNDYVSFTGWINETEAKALLAKSDVFVHPSITPDDGDKEGLPVSIMEAMAMSLPVFATHHSGIPEIVEHEVNGLLAEEKDIDSYVNCLERMLNWELQPGNRQKILDQFNHANYINKLLTIYQQKVKEFTSSE